MIALSFCVRLRAAMVACAFFILLMAGCSKSPPSSSVPIYHVSGQVIYNDKPLNKAIVTFHPVDGTMAPGASAEVCVATSDKDGRFSPNPGLWPGEYLVTVQKLKKVAKGSEERKNALPVKYENPSSSGLKIVVKSEDMILEPFTLSE